jgi:ASC-1-like (ASCH) protein
MNIWQSGRESKMFNAIIDARKTIEGRLNRGKFAQYRPGDTIELRRDTRDESGRLHDGDKPEVRVQVVAVRRYDSFLEMLQTEDLQKVIPGAVSAQAAANEYNTYYSRDDQTKYGVLAIEIKFAGAIHDH